MTVVVRHPLDAAVSLHHQGHNIDRQRVAELTGSPELAERKDQPPIDVWLRSWIESDAAPADELESFNGVFHHLNDAWRRRDDPNVMLVHYQDLLEDLAGEMRRVASGLGIAVSDELLDELAEAASFQSMRARSRDLAPDPSGVLKDASAFFRHGRSGARSEILGAHDLAQYHSRAAASAPPDLLDWLHRT